MVSRARSGPGSASTCRLTRTSSLIGSPANGLSGGNGASASGSDQDNAPPSARSPARSRAGTRSSVAGGELGAGEAQQHAAGLDPGFELGPLLGVDVPPVSAMTSSDSGCCSSSASRPLANLGERPQGAVEEVELGQQRLIARRLRGAPSEPDGAAAPALVEQERCRRCPVRARTRAGRSGCAARPALRAPPWRRCAGRVERRRNARQRFAVGAQGHDLVAAPARRRRRPELGLELAAAGLAQAQHQRQVGGRLGAHLHRARADAGLAEAGGGRLAFAVREPVAQPDHRGPVEPGVVLERLAARRRGRPARAAAASRAGPRAPHRRSAAARRACRPRRSAVGAVASSSTSRPSRSACCSRSRATAIALVPVLGRGPAIVDHQQQRAAAAQARRGIEHRVRPAPGSAGPPAARRSSSSHHGVRAGVRSAADQPGQEPERRKGDAPRRRRRHPQQQPQGRQRQRPPAAARAG